MISFDDSLHKLTDASIMIVDDEPITIDVVQAFLEEENYHNFILVEDSTRAMRILEEQHPDIILLDLIMPEVSGFEILSAARAHPKFKYLPIIILTASSDTNNKLKALKLGATDFLAKPVDQSELVLRVRNNLAAKAYQDQLAFYDSVTGLPNRHLFMKNLSCALKVQKRGIELLALLIIQLDNFDKINDTIGLDAGDEILSRTSYRIRKIIREYDEIAYAAVGEDAGMTLFHMGKSVFSLVIKRIQCKDSAAIAAERIIKEIGAPMRVMSKDIYLSTSIGISTCPPDSDDPAELHRLASSAKDFAKNLGGDFFMFSSLTIQEMYQKQLDLENRLRRAIENEELIVYYQPKVDIQTGVIKGAEALLRWDTDEGFISPMEFIPLAEESGLIISIGDWVLRQVCETLRKLQQSGRNSITLSVNISAKQFDAPDFLSKIGQIISASGADARSLTLELTESLLLGDIEEKIKILGKLKEMGMKLSIDDFGTGYSSLSYLRKLPVDELKIDRSFIMEVTKNEDTCAIVATIAFLANKLKLSTVAEGIEKKEELEFLQGLGCDQYQGFYFSRAVPIEDLFDMLPRDSEDTVWFPQ